MYKTNIIQYFPETLRKHGQRVAVYDNGESITFAGLYEKVLSLAFEIRKKLGGETGKIIAVALPKCLDAVVADLAILYSGNAYMNLDIKNPESRLLNILRQTNPKLIIFDNINVLPGHIQIGTFNIDDYELKSLSQDQKTEIFKNLDKVIDTDLLCVINTSGSTGIPKAVALNHRSFIDFTEVVCESGFVGENEIVGSLSPVIFDIFSFELCMLLAKGATLVLLPEKLAAFPASLLEMMAAQQVSFIFWVPTIMVNIANMDLLNNISLPALKMVWFAGEVFPTAKFNYWRQKLPWTKFINFYGPIEITLDCLYYIVERPLKDDEPIPIGKPFRNTAILILDENDQSSDEGELCIRGSSLAMGYYNNPEKTAAAFIQNPLNSAYPEIIYRTGDIVSKNAYGEIVFRGRKDTLVKHLGYRIELAEIEHVAINVLKIVDNCCIIHDAENRRIVMIYEFPCQISDKDFRQALSKILPKYMVPTRYIHMATMPRNANGKIDRAALKDRFKEIAE